MQHDVSKELNRCYSASFLALVLAWTSHFYSIHITKHYKTYHKTVYVSLLALNEQNDTDNMIATFHMGMFALRTSSAVT